MINEYNKTIRNKNVIIRCDNEYEANAVWYLNQLDADCLTHDIIQDNAILEYGICKLILKEVNSRYIVMQPNYQDLSGEYKYSDTLDFTFCSGNRISNFHKLLNIDPIQTTLHQTCIIHKDLASDIYMERLEPINMADSGWYIGSIQRNPQKIEQLESVFLMDIVKKTPSILTTLCLPIGFMVVIRNNRIISVCDDSNDEVYNINKI